MMIAIDDFDKIHHSLQLNLNRWLGQNNNQVTITHNDAISIAQRWFDKTVLLNIV